MPFKTGRTKTGGRKKGVRNLPSRAERLTAARKAAAEEEIRAAKEAFQAAMSGATQFTPVQIMQAITMLRISQGDYEGALEAAREAAPYVHPKLNAAVVSVRHTISESSDVEIAEAITTLRAKLALAKALPESAATIEATASERSEEQASQAGEQSTGTELSAGQLPVNAE